METTLFTPPSSAPETKPKDNNDSSSSRSFAFLVHSQKSLNHNLPPEVDNPPLARQKRRRTSPEDHAILEAEFAKNSKPDKAALERIASLTALGKKEVQIWFQNRRQMTRRKTRPLLLHEIMSLRSSQESRDNATGSNHSIDDGSQQTLSSSQSSVDKSQLSTENTHKTSNAHGVSVEGRVLALTSEDPGAAFPKSGNSQSGAARVKTQASSLPTVHARRGPGNRRSAPFAICQDHICQDHPADVQSAAVVEHLQQLDSTTLGLKRPKSLIKLSTSIDGLAQVTTNSQSLPQVPPMPDSTATSRDRRGLQRSQSAIEPANVSQEYLRHSVTGRSRDARTWEFYCDSDTRDALTKQAEREQSGSAIGPIGLIRSRSNTATLQTTNKRNAMTSKRESSKRKNPDCQQMSKPKLARASSSVARLQLLRPVTGNVQKGITAEGEVEKPKAGSTQEQDYSGDSDKENWVPGTRSSNIRRRSTATPQRAVLRESQDVSSRSSSIDALMNNKNLTPRRSRPKQPSNGRGATPSELDDEVTAFMDQAGKPSEEPEDLDCVQNLLSLSQAAWH
ncbi:hypothetical protein MMC07_003020 [Pseudocyphellaria aurata]|nr:hypothetical protein [Pseudocyphellaria aurata]